MSAGIEVFVFRGSKFLGSRCFSAASLIIGRGRDAGLKLQDPGVEDRHAMVRLEGADLVIADTSQSGITVNGQPVRLCRISSMDEVAIGPFRLKLSILGQEEDAFGGEPAGQEEEAPTGLRGARPGEREDATLPRLDLHGEYSTDFDEEETRAARPSRKSEAARFSAADKLRARSPYHEEPPAEEEFQAPTGRRRGASRQPAQPAARQKEQPAARGRPEAQRETAARLRAEPGLAHARTEHPPAGAARQDRRRRQPEPQPEPELEPVAEESAATSVTQLEEDEAYHGQLRAEAELDEDDEEEELWEEPFSLLENIVRERFKTPIETEPTASVEVIHYAGNEMVDLLRAKPGETLQVGLDKFELIKLESGRALLYFNREFTGTLVSKGKARPLKAFCTENYLVDDELFGVVMQEGDYAQVLRNGIGYLVRFVKPPLMPRAKGGLPITVGGIQAFVASLACHFMLVVLFAVLSPETVLPVEGDSERFAKVSLKDLDLEKAVKEDKPEAKKEEAPPPTKDIPKETKIVKKAPRERLKVTTQNVPLTTKQKERVQKKAVASVMTALENLKPAGAGPGRADIKALASNISAVRSPAGAAASFRVSGVIGRIGGDGVRLAGGFGGGGKDTRVGSQLLAGGAKGVGGIAALAGTGTKVRGRVAKAPARSVTTSGGQCDRAVIQNVVGSNMHMVQSCYERILLTQPGLAGKIVFDWTIAMGGGVSSARMVSSSMSSPAVATCILSLIRTWRFSPCPIGGPVEVRYPFVFRVSGF